MRSQQFAVILMGALLAASAAQAQQAGSWRQQQSAGGQAQRGNDRVRLRQELRERMLKPISQYPDEVVVAIFTVAQDPDSLVAGVDSENPEWNTARDFLANNTDLIPIMKGHPASTRWLGRFAERDAAGAWQAVDTLRAGGTLISPELSQEEVENLKKSAEKSGAASSTQLSGGDQSALSAASAAGATVVVEQTGPASTETTITTTNGSSSVTTASMSAGGTISGGTVVDGHVDTARGTATIDQSGSFTYNTRTGEAASAQTGTVQGAGGESVDYQRSGESAVSGNTFTHEGSGSAAASTGESMTWTTKSSGEKTESGASWSGTTEVTTAQGGSATVDHTTDVTKTEEGYDVERAASGETSSGKTWEFDSAKGEWSAALKQANEKASAALATSSFARKAPGTQTIATMNADQLEEAMRKAQTGTREAFSMNEQLMGGMNPGRSSQRQGAGAMQGSAGNATRSSGGVSRPR